MSTTDHKRLPQRYALNALKPYRKARGLSQRDVARILGLRSSSQISRWETGATPPSLLNAMKLAVLYRALVDALFIDLRHMLQEEIYRKEEASHVLRAKPRP